MTTHKLRHIASLLLAALIPFLCSCDSGSNVMAKRSIRGDYDVLLELEPHTKQKVHLMIINSFTCSACSKFNSKIAKLTKIYGEKISVEYYDIIIDEQSEDAALAHFLSRKNGTASKVREYLFKNSATSSTPLDFGKIRDDFGVDVFSTEAEVRKIVTLRSKAALKIADRTPMIIIEGKIVVGGNYGEITSIVDQMLISTDNL